MNYKKNWFGWLNFFLSAGLFSVLLCSLFILFFSVYVKTSFVSDYSYLFAAFSVLALYGFFFLLNFIKSKFNIKNLKGWKIAGNICTSLLFIAITGLCIYFAIHRCIGFLSGTICFEANNSCAAIIDSLIYNTSTPNCSPLTFSYCYIIFIIFKFFGINLAYAGIFEVILFILSAVFLFFSILILLGRTPAVFGYFFITVFYSYLNPLILSHMDTFTLLLFLFSFVFFMFSLVLNARNKGSMRSNTNIILFILFGLLFGLLIYLEFSMLFMFLGMAYVVCTLVNDDADQTKFVNRRLWPAFCFILSGILVAAGCSLLDIVLSGGSILERIFMLGTRFYLINLFNALLPTEYLYECIVLLSFCLFACLGFLTSRKKDKYGAIFFSYILFVLLSSFSLISINVSFISCLFFGILVGCGIQEVLFNSFNKDNNIFNQEELIILSDDNDEANEFNDSVVSGSDNKTEAGEVDSAPVVITVSSITKAEEPAETVEKEFDKSAMIDNPLPVPKKHVKKSIDYPIDITDDKMDYDIRIKDDDDFDI